MDEHLLRAGTAVLLQSPNLTHDEREAVVSLYGHRFHETPDGYHLRPEAIPPKETSAMRVILPRVLDAAQEAPPCRFPFPCERRAARDGLCVPHWSFTNKRGWAPV